MIGVISRKNQRAFAEEFFELFKTPWEHYRENGNYDVVITTDPSVPIPRASMVVVCGAEEMPHDRKNGITISTRKDRGDIRWEGTVIPVYRGLATFENQPVPFMAMSGEPLGTSSGRSQSKFLRLGYDLFNELAFLLCEGQPVDHAQIPTLEIHIDMLRNWILRSGIPLVEIPPSPHGQDFITCLTHDIDFMGIRDHKFDHTMFGFIYRSFIPIYLKGAEWKTFRARYVKNLRALLSVPLIHLGLLPDFWYPLDRYLEVERDIKSTFYFLPFMDRPGESPDGKTAKYRSARYDMAQYSEAIRSMICRGNEIGLHGIDCWRDPGKGREEVEVIRGITGIKRIGVRMHWLYYSDQTPKHLEESGVYYDSTLGYNDTVGFRSGTTQVFRLPGTANVFELPLHVQDTAMFYPGRMAASESRAIEIYGKFIKDMRVHGGVFTVNWHDRSLVPERNWDAAYLALLEMLHKERSWFTTAGEAVAWFEKRRGCRFEQTNSSGNVQKIRVRMEGEEGGPMLALRIHHPMNSITQATRGQDPFVDHPLIQGGEFSISV